MLEAENSKAPGQPRLRRQMLILSLWLVAGLALFLAGSAFTVCRDWTFICENTGSRRGHREWFFGLETGVWYHPSALDEFMWARFPTGIHQRWTSCAGTGRNIFGQTTVCGHGMPGPIIDLNPVLLDEYVRNLDDKGKQNLYDLFRSGNEQEIRALERKMLEKRAGADGQK